MYVVCMYMLFSQRSISLDRTVDLLCEGVQVPTDAHGHGRKSIKKIPYARLKKIIILLIQGTNIATACTNMKVQGKVIKS